MLAGARLAGEFAQVAQTDIKALTPFGGETFLEIVLCALRESGRVNEIVVVGNVNALQGKVPDGVRIVADGQSGPANVEIGLNALSNTVGDSLTLIVASDLPFLHAQAICSLLDNIPLSDADIVFPLTSRAVFERMFPGMPRVWTPIANYPCTGGSVLLMRPDAVRRNRALIERVFAARKSQWQMAMLLGLPFVFRFKTGKLTVMEAQNRASEITGCRCAAVTDADPRLVLDVDDMDEYRQAERHRLSRAGAE